MGSLSFITDVVRRALVWLICGPMNRLVAARWEWWRVKTVESPFVDRDDDIFFKQIVIFLMENRDFITPALLSSPKPIFFKKIVTSNLVAHI